MDTPENILLRIADVESLNRARMGCRVKNRRWLRELQSVNISTLSAKILDDSYVFSPAQKVVLKQGDKQRTIHILVPADWLVHRSALAHLSAAVQRAEHECSCFAISTQRGFSPRGCHSAISHVAEIRRSRRLLYRGDFKNFFPSVPSKAAANYISNIIGDASCSSLISRAYVVADREPGASYCDSLIQGAPLSPYVASVYAFQFDLEVVRAGWGIVRYVDDFIIVGSLNAVATQDSLAQYLPNGLEMHPSKCCRVELNEPVTFLGLTVLPSGELRIPPKAISRLEDRIDEISSGEVSRKALADTLQGWWNYFRIGVHSKGYEGIVSQRLASKLIESGLLSRRASVKGEMPRLILEVSRACR